MKTPAILALLLFTALLAALSCVHSIGEPRAQISSASVVTLLRVQHAPPCLDLPEEQCRYADAWEPVCSAFAVRGASGETLLVTAAHCTPEKLGSTLRYYAPTGVGHDKAILVARDEPHDIAVLQPEAPQALVPLQRAVVPDEGSRVQAISALYRESSFGEVVTQLGQGLYETTQTIVFGWSGAPVLDDRGRVWGLVSKCPVDKAQRCEAGHTYVASLGTL